MAQFNGNNQYLEIDGTPVTAQWIEGELSQMVDMVDVTQGAGTEHKMRATRLRDHKISFTIGYDPDNIQTLLPLLRPGVHTLTFGPEGNVTGKPKHVQAFVLKEAPLKQDVGKSLVTFTITGEAAGAPTTDMYNGGVW